MTTLSRLPQLGLLVVSLLAVFPAPAQPTQLTPVKVEQRKAKPVKFRGEVLVITRAGEAGERSQRPLADIRTAIT